MLGWIGTFHTERFNTDNLQCIVLESDLYHLIKRKQRSRSIVTMFFCYSEICCSKYFTVSTVPLQSTIYAHVNTVYTLTVTVIQMIRTPSYLHACSSSEVRRHFRVNRIPVRLSSSLGNIFDVTQTNHRIVLLMEFPLSLCTKYFEYISWSCLRRRNLGVALFPSMFHTRLLLGRRIHL